MWFSLRPVGPDYGSSAPKSFVYDVELAAPPDVVFAILADAKEWPKWFPDMTGMKWLSPEAERGKVGARRLAETRSGDVEEHFIVWEPNRRIAFYAERMSTPLVTEFMEDYHLEAAGPDKTRLKWLVHYRPRTAIAFLHPIIRPIFDRMFRKGSEALVTYVARRSP
jgi:hypothetical protein